MTEYKYIFKFNNIYLFDNFKIKNKNDNIQYPPRERKHHHDF